MEKQTIENARAVVMKVFELRNGRRYEELSPEERQKIKQMYDSSYDYAQVLDFAGFGYRKHGNKVSRICDQYFRQVGDDRDLTQRLWDCVNYSLRHWDGKSVKSFETILNRNFATMKAKRLREESKRVERNKTVDIDQCYEVGFLEKIPIEEREAVISIRDYLRKHVKVKKDKQAEFFFILDMMIHELTDNRDVIRFPYQRLSELTVQRYGGTVASRKKLIVNLRRRIKSCLKSYLQNPA